VATKRKDLRSGHPVWQGRPAPRVALARLSRDVTTDVLVMGAGITGAVIADALASTRIKVAVVDKRGPARGSTAASKEHENEARRAAGLASRFLNRRALHDQFGIARVAALMGYGNLVIDPRKSALGQVPGMPHCWIALGYGGNGTTYAAIAGDVIVGAIVGRPDVDADLYHFPAHERVRGTAPERR
jgi:glycine/D-amino acid oxidase-like deaminating enzyme